jgi:hypothetical protein
MYTEIMRKLNDLTGQKFNYLTVLKPVKDERSGRHHWLCRCDCGKECVVRTASLRGRQYNQKSCGCRNSYPRPEMRVLPGYAAANSVFLTYRRNAARRGIQFEISFLEFKELAESNCRYCGREPSNNSQRGNSATPWLYNGVDRINNDLGYVENNVAPACKQCNVAKLNYTEEQFLSWIKTVYLFNFGEFDGEGDLNQGATGVG